jgi:hypothetical protein
VVFVDAVAGYGPPGTVVLLEADEAAATAGPRYDHAAGLAYLLRALPAAGLAYLLRALPAVCAGRVPRVQVVGLADAGAASASLQGVDEAAALALRLVGG